MKVVELSLIGKVNIKFGRRAKKYKGLICNLRNKEGLKITRKETELSERRGEGRLI